MGAAHARRLAEDGAVVAVNDRSASSALSDLAQEIGGIAVPADVSDPDQVERMVAQVADRIGDVGVLVANHAHMTMAPLLSADLDDWWSVIDVNLGGTFWLVQAVLPGMRRRGFGRVIVVSSEWGVTGWPGASAYSASKAGLVALVKTLGRELAPEGIIVNGVAPGVTDTPQLQVDAADAGISLEQMHALYAKQIPLGRIGRPDELAAVVALLADPSASAMVGQVLQANGGSTRSRV
ncbi:MAG: SDR family oxidoreductase [Actinomycetota bacterium]|nr:SDR family oxidoreductase [Actinomycetota bacterium]